MTPVAARNGRAIALMYHDVVTRGAAEASGFPGADAAVYKLDPEEFEKHLRAITAVSSPRLVFDLQAGDRLPLLLTFDDGGVSAYTRIAPLLEELGWRGHFLITTDYIGTKPFLTRDQIGELRRRGHVIGTHSSSHPLRMAACGWEQLLREWGASVEKLSEILGERVKVASVPGGHYSSQVAEAAARAGIEVLFTSEPTARPRWVDGCLVLGRYSIRRGTPPAIAAALAAGCAGPRLRQWLFWNAKKVTKAVGGEYYLRLRRSLLWHKHGGEAAEQ